MAKSDKEVKIIYTNEAIMGCIEAQLQCKIRLNEVTGKIEVTWIAGKRTDEMSDAILAKFVNAGNRLEPDYGIQFGKERLIHLAMIDVAAQRKYNPLKEYFEKCEKLTLDSDSPSQLQKFVEAFKVADEHADIADVFLRKWLVGCIARLYTGHQNFMLILQGAQGTGKSTVFKKLCGSLLRYYSEQYLNPRDKDAIIQLASKFIWTVEEFGSVLQSKDRNDIKAFLTMEEIDVRKSYARHSERLTRVCSFAGTTNDSEILTDPTGNRRYLIIPLESGNPKPLDFETVNAVDYDLLWGEAMALFRTGEESYQLTESEKRMQVDANSSNEIADPMHELMKTWVEKAEMHNFIPTLDLMAKAKQSDMLTNNFMCKKIAETMQRMGFVKSKSMTQRGYAGCAWKPGMSPSATVRQLEIEANNRDNPK